MIAASPTTPPTTPPAMAPTLGEDPPPPLSLLLEPPLPPGEVGPAEPEPVEDVLVEDVLVVGGGGAPDSGPVSVRATLGSKVLPSW
jgi:hypothetical protein